jgi:predicted ATPase
LGGRLTVRQEGQRIRRFIITGTPGAGKTAIVRQLALDGFSVVEEAATDVITAAHARGAVDPWRQASFIDDIVNLQRERQVRAASTTDDVQFHDRCVVCTAALARHLGYPVSPVLAAELERVTRDRIYESRVFFIRSLGFIAPTDARRISLEDAARFEKVHEDTYRALGFELVFIEPGTVAERVRAITAAVCESKPAP